MRSLVLTLMVGALTVGALVSGCASSSDVNDSSEGSPNFISFAQIKGAPDSYKGQTVTLGGEVLSAKRLKDGTRIEVLQLPLGSSKEPSTDLTQSQGRFVAIQRNFLDPATLPPGTFVTVAGDVNGTVTLPLDETEYTYPIIEIKDLKVWSPSSETSHMRMRPIAPYPYWNPYWGPYWRPYPYW
ncbi:MAG: Slp family lipoprotein [Nitrospiraceae bacterium]